MWRGSGDGEVGWRGPTGGNDPLLLLNSNPMKDTKKKETRSCFTFVTKLTLDISKGMERYS